MTVHKYQEVSSRCHGKSDQEGITAMQIENNKRHVQQSIGQRKGDRVMSRTLIQLSVCMVVLAMSAAAQTNTFPATGDVGIGTTSPAYSLDIVGNLRLSTANPYIYINGTYSGLPNLGSIGIRSAGEVVLDANTNDTAIPNWEIKYGSGTNYNFPVDAFYVGRAPSPTQTLTEFLTINSSGNVGIGTAAPAYNLDVVGVARAQAGIIYPDGKQQTTAWTGVLCGGDYAEDMRAEKEKETYEPGDVLVLTSDDNSDIQKSADPYSTMVAGIYATKPGVVGLREAVSKSPDNIPMAMVGVVPTKVTAENGPIHKGDLLVTSSRKGYAMKGTDRGKMLGAVLGKAMGSLDSGTGVIEVLVTLQ
jgi:hypothetical protein